MDPSSAVPVEYCFWGSCFALDNIEQDRTDHRFHNRLSSGSTEERRFWLVVLS